jgi:hypothetical protein
MVKHQARLGGWNCFGSGRNLDSWEPISAFAALPRQKWTKAMNETVAKGAEFFLERELHKQGAPYKPWLRFHYPIHYHYDVLHGLYVLTALSDVHDQRINDAVDLLIGKRGKGTWFLDGAYRGWVYPHSANGDWVERPEEYEVVEDGWGGGRTLQLEEAGKPSKMITLRCLIVLKRLGVLNVARGSRVLT